MKVLGIDPGFTSGYAVIENNNIIVAGEFKVSKTNRLKSLFDFYMKLILDYNPDICIIENSYVNNNARTSIILGQSKGVIELTFQLNNKNYFCLAPCQMKKYIMKKGNAKKLELQEYINNLFNLNVSHNVTDAIAISLCDGLMKIASEPKEKSSKSKKSIDERKEKSKDKKLKEHKTPKTDNKEKII